MDCNSTDKIPGIEVQVLTHAITEPISKGGHLPSTSFRGGIFRLLAPEGVLNDDMGSLLVPLPIWFPEGMERSHKRLLCL